MISVVIPAYNEEKRIKRSLEALSHQTIPRDEYEIIVVDGGSHDETYANAEGYAAMVFVQESEPFKGQVMWVFFSSLF